MWYFYWKKETYISNIFIRNLSNNNNDLENEINKHLNLFNDSINKTQYFNDVKYKDLIDNLELEYDNKFNNEVPRVDNQIANIEIIIQVFLFLLNLILLTVVILNIFFLLLKF